MLAQYQSTLNDYYKQSKYVLKQKGFIFVFPNYYYKKKIK